MIDFAGWELPLWYTSVLEEHSAVRTRAGIFDVSHMRRIRISGYGASEYLDYLLTRPAHKIEVGSGCLSLLCLDDGGILDDLVIYRLETEKYLVVWNAANFERKWEWIFRHNSFQPGVHVEDASDETAMIAIQGPLSSQIASFLNVDSLPRFSHKKVEIGDTRALIARTGYTGEDGFELIVNSDQALPLWNLLLHNGAKPCGLGARDILRLEAGMLLYGQDMDTSVNPYEAGLGWMVHLNKVDFIGKTALLRIHEEGVKRKLIGFIIEGNKVARNGCGIYRSNEHIGDVTSGGYSPTLSCSIGLGYVPVELSKIGTKIQIMVRDKAMEAYVVNKRFLRRITNES
jgi:aminomethyltransferase